MSEFDACRNDKDAIKIISVIFVGLCVAIALDYVVQTDHHYSRIITLENQLSTRIINLEQQLDKLTEQCNALDENIHTQRKQNEYPIVIPPLTLPNFARAVYTIIEYTTLLPVILLRKLILMLIDHP